MTFDTRKLPTQTAKPAADERNMIRQPIFRAQSKQARHPHSAAAAAAGTRTREPDRPSNPTSLSSNRVLATKNRTSQPSRSAPVLRVLHIGCGADSPTRLHSIFRSQQWDEIRFDIDEATRPDIRGSAASLQPWVQNESCDAIWASHVLEHLARHELPKALNEFRRILVPTGFALVRVPDVETVAEYILAGRIRDVIYHSPAGPITPLDMLYGHGAAIERGHQAMRHGTAFTQELLAQDLLSAGFAEVRTARTETHEVWALALMPAADRGGLVRDLARTGLDLRGDSSAQHA